MFLSKWLLKRKRIRDGQEIIEHSLLVSEFREEIEVIRDEINFFINTKRFSGNCVNIYHSKVGRIIRFYTNNHSPKDYEDCEVFFWGDWLMFNDRFRFEWNAYKNRKFKVFNID